MMTLLQPRIKGGIEVVVCENCGRRLIDEDEIVEQNQVGNNGMSEFIVVGYKCLGCGVKLDLEGNL